MKTFIKSAIFLIIALNWSAVSAGTRISTPDGVYYHRFASSVYGPEATWINPAGLGHSKDINLQYIGELGVGRFDRNWGYNITGDGVGIGYRHFEELMGEKYDEYIFAAGAGLGPKFFWGLSYRYVKNGPDVYNKRHFWNMGFLIKSNPKFSMAALFSNLNRSQVNGKRTDIEQLYSFSYGLNGDRVVISVEITLSTSQNLSDAEYNYGVEIIPLKGLILYGNLHNNDSFEAGFRVNLRKYFAGCQSRFDSDGSHIGTPFYIGYNTGQQPSIIPPKKKARY